VTGARSPLAHTFDLADKVNPSSRGAMLKVAPIKQACRLLLSLESSSSIGSPVKNKLRWRSNMYWPVQVWPNFLIRKGIIHLNALASAHWRVQRPRGCCLRMKLLRSALSRQGSTVVQAKLRWASLDSAAVCATYAWPLPPDDALAFAAGYRLRRVHAFSCTNHISLSAFQR